MSEKLKFIYIEDTRDGTTESFQQALASHSNIDIKLISVKPFETQVDEILKYKDLQGVILDLKLDENPADNPSPVKYTAPALAQALRSKFAEQAKSGIKMDIPIILFSTDTNILNSYELDISSHDLFDFRMSKDETKKYKKYSQQLYSIAQGYLNIRKTTSINLKELLNFNISLLDPRVFEGCNRPDITAFELAKRVLRGLIFYDSPLISEPILAARLGVDMTAQEWPEVKAIFKKSKYIGIFSDAWDRWWMPVVNDLFKEISGGKLLSNLTAKERSAIISKIANKIIAPATPIEQSKSTRFWTICRCLNRPLDPSEGFRIARTDTKPWQDSQYISLKAALDRMYVGKFELEEIEKQRLQAIKDGLK